MTATRERYTKKRQEEEDRIQHPKPRESASANDARIRVMREGLERVARTGAKRGPDYARKARPRVAGARPSFFPDPRESAPMLLTRESARIRGIQDPDKLGRVKVKLETLGDNTESDWLPVLQPFAGQESGTFLLPEPEDQVIVAYLDPRHLTGFVLGSVWNETNTPPSTGENSSADLNEDGKNNLKFIKTRSGQQIILDDTEGKEKITILSASGATRFELNAEKKLLTLETDKDITITAKGKISITAKEMTVETTKATSLKAAGMGLESTSKKIGLKASQDIEATGGTIKLN